MLFTTDGLVTKVYDTEGNEKNIQIITPEYGRISVWVMGGKSLKGTQTACSQLFTYGNFEITRRGDRNWLRGGSVNMPFYGLSESIENMALASYICDLANEVTGDGETAGEVLRLVLNTLYAIEHEVKPREQIKAVFELRIAVLSGYCPDLSGCRDCESDTSESLYVDVMNGNIVCAECLAKQNSNAKIPTGPYADELREVGVLCRITPEVLWAARYAVTSQVQKMLSFELDTEDIRLLRAFAETYILNHIEHGFSSLDFYKTLI